MRQYATAEQLAAWPGATVPPESADALLRVASRTVDSLLLARAYDVDDAGMPTDPDELQALADAACAIAAELHATGALKAGQTVAYDSAAIGNVNLSGRKTAETAAVVDGIPVPAAALSSIATVGRVLVQSAPFGEVRPLWRVER